METINSYLENVFKALPQTTEILNLKADILVNMEDKYHELKQAGKTENEAIGIVISEFGNIDEIINEMNISLEKKSNSELPMVDLEEAQNYIKLKTSVSRFIGLGVVLILISISALIGLYQMIETKLIFQSFSKDAQDMLPLIQLFVCIAISVGIFIYFGTKLDAYKYIEQGNFILNNAAKAYLTKDYKQIDRSTIPYIIIGTLLCVISPLAIFIASLFGEEQTVYGVCILILMIAAAVYILIHFCTKRDAYKELLMMDHPANSPSGKSGRVIGAVASIVWPIAVCIFLFSGLVCNAWQICWIVFPITGILFGGFSAFYSMLYDKKES